MRHSDKPTVPILFLQAPTKAETRTSGCRAGARGCANRQGPFKPFRSRFSTIVGLDDSRATGLITDTYHRYLVAPQMAGSAGCLELPPWCMVSAALYWDWAKISEGSGNREQPTSSGQTRCKVALRRRRAAKTLVFVSSCMTFVVRLKPQEANSKVQD